MDGGTVLGIGGVDIGPVLEPGGVDANGGWVEGSWGGVLAGIVTVVGTAVDALAAVLCSTVIAVGAGVEEDVVAVVVVTGSKNPGYPALPAVLLLLPSKQGQSVLYFPEPYVVVMLMSLAEHPVYRALHWANVPGPKQPTVKGALLFTG